MIAVLPGGTPSVRPRSVVGVAVAVVMEAKCAPTSTQSSTTDRARPESTGARCGVLTTARLRKPSCSRAAMTLSSDHNAFRLLPIIARGVLAALFAGAAATSSAQDTPPASLTTAASAPSSTTVYWVPTKMSVSGADAGAGTQAASASAAQPPSSPSMARPPADPPLRRWIELQTFTLHVRNRYLDSNRTGGKNDPQYKESISRAHQPRHEEALHRQRGVFQRHAVHRDVRQRRDRRTGRRLPQPLPEAAVPVRDSGSWSRAPVRRHLRRARRKHRDHHLRRRWLHRRRARQRAAAEAAVLRRHQRHIRPARADATAQSLRSVARAHGSELLPGARVEALLADGCRVSGLHDGRCRGIGACRRRVAVQAVVADHHGALRAGTTGSSRCRRLDTRLPSSRRDCRARVSQAATRRSTSTTTGTPAARN